MAEFLIATFDRPLTASDLDALVGPPLVEEEDVD